MHSSLSIIFPLHIFYLTRSTGKSTRYFLGLLLSAAKVQFSTSPGSSGFPLKNTVTAMILVTVGMTLPALLWYLAVSLASISEVTAIWNTNAFWAYLLSISAFHERLEWKKLSAVVLACVGVATVAYAGKESSDGLSSSNNGKTPSVTYRSNPSTNAPNAPLLGDLLTLLASILYAALEVFYKKYVSVPEDQSRASAAARGGRESSPLVPYRALAAEERLPLGDDSQEEIPETVDIEAFGHTANALPFGLFTNAVTSFVGVSTFLCFWPFIFLFSSPSSSSALVAQSSIEIYVTITGIALSGVFYNGAYMILLGIWGPVLSSVGNLLTIVLMLIVEALFMQAAAPAGLSLVGCVLIAGGFGVLLWDVIRDAHSRHLS